VCRFAGAYGRLMVMRWLATDEAQDAKVGEAIRLNVTTKQLEREWGAAMPKVLKTLGVLEAAGWLESERSAGGRRTSTYVLGRIVPRYGEQGRYLGGRVAWMQGWPGPKADFATAKEGNENVTFQGNENVTKGKENLTSAGSRKSLPPQTVTKENDAAAPATLLTKPAGLAHKDSKYPSVQGVRPSSRYAPNGATREDDDDAPASSRQRPASNAHSSIAQGAIGQGAGGQPPVGVASSQRIDLAVVALADAFAKRFLKRQRFGLKPGSTAYGRFAEASAMIDQKVPKMPFDRPRLVNVLFDCLEGHWKPQGRAVVPGNLCSDHTWGVLLPQHLDRMGV